MLLFVAAACTSDGRELAEAQDWQTTTTRPPPPTSAPIQQVSDSGLTLTSPDFEPGGEAPLEAQCVGGNRFPNLEWSGVPDGVGEIAVTLSDQTDPENPLLIWMMGGLDPTTRNLESGVMGPGGFETLNDYGQPGWGSPCLEAIGTGRRDLQFRVYMLPAPTAVSAGDPGNEAWETIIASATDSASVLMHIGEGIASP